MIEQLQEKVDVQLEGLKRKFGTRTNIDLDIPPPTRDRYKLTDHVAMSSYWFTLSEKRSPLYTRFEAIIDLWYGDDKEKLKRMLTDFVIMGINIESPLASKEITHAINDLALAIAHKEMDSKIAAFIVKEMIHENI